MRERVPEDIPPTLQQAVDEQAAGHRSDCALIGDVDTPRAAYPVEIAVEELESDDAEPVDRHGVADQCEDTNEMVRPAPMVGGAHDAHRNSQRNADQNSDGGQLDCRGEYLPEIDQHRLG